MTDLLADPDPARYSVSGLVGDEPTGAFLGDSVETAFTGKPLLTSAGGAADADVTPGGYAISIEQGSLVSAYELAFDGAGILTVNPKEVTLDGLTADPKVYDGTTPATLNTAGAVLVGVLFGDDVNPDFSGATAQFDDPNAGDGKPVTVTGISLSGGDAGNYTLTTVNAVTGSIPPRTITVELTGEVRKTYDATTAALLTPDNFTLSNVLEGELVFLSHWSARYDTPDAGSGKMVTAEELTLGGTHHANYSLNAASVAAAIGVIEKAPLTVRADDVTVERKQPFPVFTATYAGFVGGEDPSVLDGELSIITPASPESPVGEYPLQPAGLTAVNYEIEFVPGVLSIVLPGGRSADELTLQLLRQPFLAAIVQDERLRSLFDLMADCRMEELVRVMPFTRFSELGGVAGSCGVRSLGMRAGG